MMTTSQGSQDVKESSHKTLKITRHK